MGTVWAGWGDLTVSSDVLLLSWIYFETSRKRDIGSPEEVRAVTLVCGPTACRSVGAMEEVTWGTARPQKGGGKPSKQKPEPGG